MNKSAGPSKLQLRLVRPQFEYLIPHTGRMCLIDSVEHWNDHSICCLSETHLEKSNPLCTNGALSSIHLLEYGAQSMAIHGGLLKGSSTRGMLAALRNVKLYVDNTEGMNGAIRITAVAKANSARAAVYNFQVSAIDETVLVEARATVINPLNELSRPS